MKARHLLQKSLSRLGLLIYRNNHPAARYFNLRPSSGLTYALHRAFKNLRGLHFIQIGANDGERCDPLLPLIQRFSWTGTLVEPRHVFMKTLKQRYSENTGIRLVQGAIAQERSSRNIYFINPEISDLPDWTLGLATLNRERIETACRELNLPDNAICEETVRCLTWEDLEPETALDATDLLVIDVEGFDIDLLNLWNWEKRRPRVVHFEHGCSHPEAYVSFLHKIRPYGYEMVTEGVDTTLFFPHTAA